MSNRNNLRAKTLGAPKKFASKVVEIEGEKFFCKAPTIAARSAIMQAAKALNGDKNSMDLAGLQVECVLKCVFDESGVPVFEEGDRQSLLGMPCGSFVETLGATVLELMNVDHEGLEKNSDGTANDNCSL